MRKRRKKRDTDAAAPLNHNRIILQNFTLRSSEARKDDMQHQRVLISWGILHLKNL